MIIPTQSAVFIHINNTGGTSMEEILRPYITEESCAFMNLGVPIPYKKLLFGGTNKHANAIGLEQFLGSKIFKSYFKFTFVRNPWDKMVSWFSKRKEVAPSNTLRQTNKWDAWGRVPAKEYENISFLDWIKRDTASKIDPSRRKYTNQVDWLKNESGDITVDFIGRFERLHQDWKLIADKIGIDQELPHINKSAHNGYRSYYNDESNAIIEDLFAKDIEHFGYEF